MITGLAVLWGLFLGLTYLWLPEERKRITEAETGKGLAMLIPLLVLFVVLSVAYGLSVTTLGRGVLWLGALLGWLQLTELISLTHNPALATMTGETSKLYRCLGYHRWPWVVTVMLSYVYLSQLGLSSWMVGAAFLGMQGLTLSSIYLGWFTSGDFHRWGYAVGRTRYVVAIIGGAWQLLAVACGMLP